MKKTLFTLSALLISGVPVFAKTKETEKVTAVKIQCLKSALDAATYIDVSGWGRVPNEPLVVTSSCRQGPGEAFKVKSAVSGYMYTIKMIQDYKSQACIVLSIDSQDFEPLKCSG